MTTNADGQEIYFRPIDLRRATAQERLSFGGTIRTTRIAQGLSQEELAEMAGISRRTLGNIERGDVAGQAANLTRVLVALGIDIEPRQYSDFTEQTLAALAPLLDAVPEAEQQATMLTLIRTVGNAIKPTPADAHRNGEA